MKVEFGCVTIYFLKIYIAFKSEICGLSSEPTELIKYNYAAFSGRRLVLK